MAIDFSKLLNPLLQGVGQSLPGLFTQRGIAAQPSPASFSLNPSGVLGAGLLGAGLLSDKEPGEVTEARQFLRNRFTSSNALSDQLGAQLPALRQNFQPLLDQNAQRQIEGLTQRYKAAFPATVGAQGPEFGGLSRLITDELLPQQQAFYGNLGLGMLDRQGRAAETLLQTGRPDAMSQLASLLGYDLLTRGQGGGGASGLNLNSLLGLSGQTASGGNLLPTGSSFAPMLMQAVTQANAGNPSLLTTLLSSGSLAGTPFPISLQASTPAGQLIQQAINAGLVESPAAQAVRGAGLPGTAPGTTGFQGLLGRPGVGSTSGLLSGAGTIAGGYFAGNQIGQWVDRMDTGASGALSAGGGAAGGAALGFALGGPVGGVLGAIAGGIGGVLGERSARHARKEGSIAQETAQTNAARPQALQSAEGIRQASVALTTQLQQANTQGLASKFRTLFNSGDAGAQAFLNEARQLGLYNVSYTHPDTAIDILNGLAEKAGWGSWAYAPGAEANPESAAGLLRSTEVGKFGPGTQFLTTGQTLYPKLADFQTRLIQYVMSR